MLTVSIHQPGYLPWLGYFEKIARSDMHVFFDDVQFEKNSFDNRNKVLAAGGDLWLTVPVITKGRFGVTLNEVEIDSHAPWRKKHWKTIESNYSKTPYFRDHAGFFESIYLKNWTRLIDLNMEIIQYLLAELGIKTAYKFSSAINKEGKKSDLVLNLCQTLGASTYLSGALGRNYLNLEQFREKNIAVVFQDYQHPVYAQKSKTFLPYMSVIDLLFNEGKRSLDVILGNRGA